MASYAVQYEKLSRDQPLYVNRSMSKPVVYVLDPYHADALRLLQETSTVTFIEPHDDRKSTWHEHATAVMLRSETRLSEEDFRKAKTLKLVVKQGVGVDSTIRQLSIANLSPSSRSR